MVARFRATVLIAICPLVGSMAVVGASPRTAVAATSAANGYPHLIGQEHVGGTCTPDDAVIAGGTIVGLGGQVVAAGGGTGVGCDTFYAYEFRTGAPRIIKPFVEPGLYLNPGRTAKAVVPDSAPSLT